MNMLEREFLDEAKDLTNVSYLLFIFALLMVFKKMIFKFMG